MGLIADFRVVSGDLPLVDVAAAVPEATLRVESMQGNPSGAPAFVVSVTGGDSGSVDAAFAGATSITDHSLVVEDGTTRRYRCHPTGGPPDDLETLADNESVSDRVRVTPEGWAERRWFADRAAFDAYRSFCRENDLTFGLDRLLDVDRATGTTDPDEETSVPGRTAMTDAQHDALVTAHEMGYFDVPRNATLGDVADELGVTAPSLSERLRRAQSHLVGRLRAAEGDIKPRMD
jgi:predicted DNA binding protein